MYLIHGRLDVRIAAMSRPADDLLKVSRHFCLKKNRVCATVTVNMDNVKLL